MESTETVDESYETLSRAHVGLSDHERFVVGIIENAGGRRLALWVEYLDGDGRVWQSRALHWSVADVSFLFQAVSEQTRRQHQDVLTQEEHEAGKRPSDLAVSSQMVTSAWRTYMRWYREHLNSGSDGWAVVDTEDLPKVAADRGHSMTSVFLSDYLEARRFMAEEPAAPEPQGKNE